MVKLSTIKKALNALIVVNEKYELPSWENNMLQQLLKDIPMHSLTFFCIPSKKITKESFAYRLFCKFEHGWFRSLPDAFATINVKNQYPEASFISSANKDSPPNDFCYISCLVNEKYQAEAEPVYGTWSFVFGNEKYKGANPPAFWEVMNDENITGSTLLAKFPGLNNPLIVYDGITSTVPFSVKNNLTSLAWKSSSFLTYRLKELLILGYNAFIEKYKKAIYKNGSSTYLTYQTPGNFKMIGLFLRNNFRYLCYKIKKITSSPRFSLLYSFQQYNGNNVDIQNFKAHPLPKNEFWADPFLISKENEIFIFFEQYLYSNSKAHISLIKIDNNGNSSKPVTVLEKPYHLSYPFVFECEAEFYMIPETSANKTVELYKAIQFPDKWKFVMNLMEDIVLIDVTLLYENNTWWLFGNSTNNKDTSTNDQLFLFYSKDLLSQHWTPHPQNPIVTDISNCRPGGKIFRINNQLFRPAQNNASKQYGYALFINKIITLNETDYLEEKVSELIPDKTNGLSAIHTFNFTNGLIIIDGIVSKKQ